MKTLLKSLLFGSAAGLAAVTAAQAADLPVKAKAVEYVKVCSLYGAGFYYMPGTDTCLKVGGYLRVQYETGAWGGGATAIGAQGALTRDATPNVAYRARGDITLDARTQTAYGTLRSYIRAGWQNTDGGASAVHYDRAFIQFAGFTFGLTTSFYDFFSLVPYGYSAQRIGSDTGATGVHLAAYTAQFGNGLSGTLSLEQPRNKILADGDATLAPTLAADYSANAKAFDIVANLRVDQAWGSAQVMAAAHNASGAYGVGPIATDHPSDKWGYALGAGVLFNIPGMKGDTLGAQFNYAKGAIGYVYSGSLGNNLVLGNNGIGNSMAYGNAADGVFSTALGGIDQTTAWGFTAAYQHFWSPALRTSVWGGYTSISYSDAASLEICPAGVAALRTCNEDTSFWQVGTRTAWFPHPDLEIGLDVMYTKLNTANEGIAPGGEFADADIISAIVRVQRNFLP